MSDLKTFLEDSKQYPDNTPIRIGEVEIPLGSLRSLNASERSTLEDKLKGADETQKRVSAREKEVLDLAGKAQSAYEAAELARKTATTQPRPTGEDPFSDPWLAPVKEALSARDKTIEALQNQLKSVGTTVANAAAIYFDDRWEREYNSLDFGKRDKKPTRDELIEFAKTNNLTDRNKIPSISAAWQKMSEADRLNDTREQARQEGIEEGRRIAMAGRIQPPGVSGPGQGASAGSKGKVVDGQLPDIYAEAMEDPELRSMIERLPAGLM
jgi:hypothetical protein